MNLHLLKIESVQYHYPNSDCGIADVSLALKSGEMTGLIGPNGAGKSTLLKIAAGLIHSDKGAVSLKDQNMSKLSRKKIAKTIGYQPQMTDAGIFDHTVAEIVSMGRFPHTGGLGFLTAKDVEVIEQAMQQTDTAQFRSRRLTELSGGERQRVLLASVLTQQPEILLLDEPATGLDIHHQNMLFTLLRQQAANGLAVAVVTHDLNLAGMFCDKIVLMQSGKVVRQGNFGKVIEQDILQKVYGESIIVADHPTLNRPAVFTMPLNFNPEGGKKC